MTERSLGYARGSDTSREAAETGRASAAVWRSRVLTMFLSRADGFTADELCVWFGVQHNTIAPRVCELSQSGQIVDGNKRRKTRSGKSAAVYVAAVTQ
jgi:hypothetical protein